jgi:hypothetical protein
MRKILIALAAAGGIGIFGTSVSTALPVNGGAILGAVEATSPIQDARLYCYNRYTGRFLHWGACGRYRRPGRTYCYNRYTGRFLHWGAC